MAVHASIVAWRIPWREEPGGPQSMGSQRVHTHTLDFGYSVTLALSLRANLRELRLSYGVSFLKENSLSFF